MYFHLLVDIALIIHSFVCSVEDLFESLHIGGVGWLLFATPIWTLYLLSDIQMEPPPNFIHLLKSFESEKWFPEPALSDIRHADYPAPYLLPSPQLNETSLESFVPTLVIEISMSTVLFPFIILSVLSRFYHQSPYRKLSWSTPLTDRVTFLLSSLKFALYFLYHIFLSVFTCKYWKILAPHCHSLCQD